MSEKAGNDTKIKYRDILYNNGRLGPFPMNLLKRVDNPTNRITGPIKRRDMRENVFARSRSGEKAGHV